MMSERGVGCGISIWDKPESIGALSCLGEEAMPFRRAAPDGSDIEWPYAWGRENLGGKKAHLPNFKPFEVSIVMKFVNTEVS